MYICILCNDLQSIKISLFAIVFTMEMKWYQSPRLDQGKKDSIRKLDAMRIRKEKIARRIVIDSFKRLWLKRMKNLGVMRARLKGTCWNFPLMKDKEFDDNQHTDWDRYAQKDNKGMQVYGDYTFGARNRWKQQE